MDSSINPSKPEEGENLDIVFQFQPLDQEASSLVKQTFSDQEILESNAFTGLEILSVIILAAKPIVNRLLQFYVQYQERFKDASIKIGPEEITLKGYSMNEVEKFFDSEPVQDALRAMRKK